MVGQLSVKNREQLGNFNNFAKTRIMKQQVIISTFSLIITVASNALLIGR